MTDSRHAHRAAHVIATAVLGRDPGPLAITDSSSHQVYVGADVVVKVIDAAGHVRLEREVALAPQLPAGLTAPLLDSGLREFGGRTFRYACYARMPGAAPGRGMPGTDAATARLWAEQAVERLQRLHQWNAEGDAARTLEEPLDHGGFTGRDTLLADAGRLASADRHAAVNRRLLDGVTAIAEGAPPHAQAVVPVHADCHWDNWLADGMSLTALLDFEWARLGEPVDDWFFLTRFSGPHRDEVLAVVAEATRTPQEALRAGCEVREAAHLVSDLRAALEHPGAPAPFAAARLRSLHDLVVGRYWWRPPTR